jgi:biotin synthase
MRAVPQLTPSSMRAWLLEEDSFRLEQLWHMANFVRENTVGPAVHLRGLIEFSNRCARNCTYCGLRAANRDVTRYALGERDLIGCVGVALELGIGTLVMQSGEGVALETETLLRFFRYVTEEKKLALTLSVGELSESELMAFRDAGVNRYLLRFETSNRALYEHIHPGKSSGIPADRIAILKKMRSLNFEVGSGVMVGIPGQTIDDLVNDLLLFQELDLDMVGLGPYMPHPGTPLALEFEEHKNSYVCANREILTYKMLALTRILLPNANIPSTTALATLNTRDGRVNGLKRGANILMPNITPQVFRSDYNIYPEKAGSTMGPDDSHAAAVLAIHKAGRVVGTGRGDSLRYLARQMAREGKIS